MVQTVTFNTEPLTSLTSNNVNLKWTEIEQKAFDYIKCVVDRHTLLAYLDLNKRYDIHMDDRNNQTGSVIRHDRNPSLSTAVN